MSQQKTAAALQDPAFLELPALTPPPGVIPNFSNPGNQGPKLTVSGAILLTFVATALMNRAYTKIHIVQKLSWDDLTISLAAIGAISSYGVCVWDIQQGVPGRHQYELRNSDILARSWIIPEYIVVILIIPTLWVTKITFFLFYLQIFRPMRWLRVCLYVGATLFTVFSWSSSITCFVLESPTLGETWVEAASSPRLDLDVVRKLGVSVAAVGLTIDVLLFCLPLIAIYELQLHRNRRIGLTIIFSSGLIAVAASTVSIYYRWKLVHSGDKTWFDLDGQLLYLIEVDAGIITACIPSFAKMLHHHLPPWPTLKARLQSVLLSKDRKDSQGNAVATPKDSGSTDVNKGNSWGERPYLKYIHSGAGNELGSLRSAQYYIRSAARETFDDDRIFLKLGAQQGR